VKPRDNGRLDRIDPERVGNMIPRGTAIQVGERTTGPVRLTVYWRRGWRLDRALVVVRELSRMEYVSYQPWLKLSEYDPRTETRWERTAR